MCINNIVPQNRPYIDSSIRWKVLIVKDGKLCSYFANKIWTLGKCERSRLNKSSQLSKNKTKEDIGFHVLLTKNDAIKYAETLCDDGLIIAQVQVKGFIAAGEFNAEFWDIFKCETWRYATITNIYTEDGKLKKKL